jgi:hypothetical protein
MRTAYPKNEKKPAGRTPDGLFVLLEIDDGSPTVRRSHVPAVTTSGTAISTLAGVLLPLRDVRVELLQLIGREDGTHRRDLSFTLLLHLRTERLHLRPRRRGVAALPSRARIGHGLPELLVGRVVFLTLAHRLQLGFLIGGEVDALQQAFTGSTTHPASFVLDPLGLLRRLR